MAFYLLRVFKLLVLDVLLLTIQDFIRAVKSQVLYLQQQVLLSLFFFYELKGLYHHVQQNTLCGLGTVDYGLIHQIYR